MTPKAPSQTLKEFAREISKWSHANSLFWRAFYGRGKHKLHKMNKWIRARDRAACRNNKVYERMTEEDKVNWIRFLIGANEDRALAAKAVSEYKP